MAPTMSPARPHPARRYELEDGDMMTGRVIEMTPARRDANLGKLLAEADRVRPHPDFDGMWEVFCDGEMLSLATDDELWKHIPSFPAPDGGRSQIVPRVRAFLALAEETQPRRGMVLAT